MRCSENACVQREWQHRRALRITQTIPNPAAQIAMPAKLGMLRAHDAVEPEVIEADGTQRDRTEFLQATIHDLTRRRKLRFLDDLHLRIRETDQTTRIAARQHRAVLRARKTNRSADRQPGAIEKNQAALSVGHEREHVVPSVPFELLRGAGDRDARPLRDLVSVDRPCMHLIAARHQQGTATIGRDVHFHRLDSERDRRGRSEIPVETGHIDGISAVGPDRDGSIARLRGVERARTDPTDLARSDREQLRGRNREDGTARQEKEHQDGSHMPLQHTAVQCVHNNIAAYARNGRHRSARFSNSRSVRSPACRRSTRSPAGNASASPSRMAM